jgi:hypothetical protein
VAADVWARDCGDQRQFWQPGELPTHPELLDWLANDLRDHGWDIKAVPEADRDERDLSAKLDRQS